MTSFADKVEAGAVILLFCGFAAGLQSCSPAEAAGQATTNQPFKDTKEILALPLQGGQPAFLSQIGAVEVSWTLCVAQESACRQEVFTRQLRTVVPAGTHRLTFTVFCPSPKLRQGEQGKVLRSTRTITLPVNAPHMGNKIGVEAPTCNTPTRR